MEIVTKSTLKLYFQSFLVLTKNKKVYFSWNTFARFLFQLQWHSMVPNTYFGKHLTWGFSFFFFRRGSDEQALCVRVCVYVYKAEVQGELQQGYSVSLLTLHACLPLIFEWYEKERQNEMDCQKESGTHSEQHRGLSDADNPVCLRGWKQNKNTHVWGMSAFKMKRLADHEVVFGMGCRSGGNLNITSQSSPRP